MRVLGFGSALLFATAVSANEKGGAVSYSCPKGWEQSGDNCTRVTPVKPITKTQTSYDEVPAIESCPAGYEESKDGCTKTIPLGFEAKTVVHQVPTKVCPKGAQQTSTGCIITKTVTEKVASQNHKQVNSQRVSKKTQLITVKKPVSVASGPSSKVVTTPVAGFDLVEVSKTLRVPKDEKAVSDSGPSSVKVTNQSVKETTKERNVSVAQLVDKEKTLTLKSKVKVAQEVCPQGSTETKGACIVKVTRQVAKSHQSTRSIGSGSATAEVTKTLKVAKTQLVPQYSCPKGTQSKGATCSVTRTAQTPVTKETPRTVRIARAVKVPKTVRVPKVVAVATTECPKGASQGKGKGTCTLSTSIRVPYTVETPVTVCPGGAKEENGICLTEKTVYASPEEVGAAVPPATKKGKGAESNGIVRLECPSGYQKDSVGLCFKTEVDAVAPETITATKIEFKTETVDEVVPAIVTYTTRTEYEEVTVEEIKVEYDTQEVTETSTELATTTYSDEIPAIATYEPVTTYEEVTVTDTVACGGGAGGKGCGGEGQVVTETTFSVETETVEEEVPRVAAYSLEDHIESQSVTESVVANVPQTVTETIHVVESSTEEQTVPSSKSVTFKTVFDTITVTDKKVKITNHQQEDEVQTAPTYQTVYEDEQHEVTTLQVETVPTTLTETVVKTETRTVTEDVEAGTVLKSVTTTEQGCPDGAVAGAKGCSKTVSVAKTVSCPPGALLKHSACIERSTTTVTACPPGATESGKGCEQVETIPATAVYGSQATKSVPQPTKAAPAPTKRSLRMW